MQIGKSQRLFKASVCLCYSNYTKLFRFFSTWTSGFRSCKWIQFCWPNLHRSWWCRCWSYSDGRVSGPLDHKMIYIGVLEWSSIRPWPHFHCLLAWIWGNLWSCLATSSRHATFCLGLAPAGLKSPHYKMGLAYLSDTLEEWVNAVKGA